MSFSEEPRSYSDLPKRTGPEYVKFTDEHRVVLRMLEPKARTVWKHWISQAGTKGMGAVCLNTEPGLNVCPVEKMYGHLPKEDEERKNHSARRKFLVNVLDRTPYTTCNSCQTLTPGKVNKATSNKQCHSCGADLKGHDFSPLNKVKILEQGPRLFNDSLNPIARMQKEDLGIEITEYDITFTAQGEGRERKITALPQDPKPLPEDALLDPETGEPQTLANLDFLTEPPSSEEVELMLQGATLDQLNALRQAVLSS